MWLLGLTRAMWLGLGLGWLGLGLGWGYSYVAGYMEYHCTKLLPHFIIRVLHEKPSRTHLTKNWCNKFNG